LKKEACYITTKTQLSKKPTITKTVALKILGKTPYMTGFHFYASVGNYTEETVTSLSELAEVLKTIAESTIRFHFPRQDFQKWIRGTIGDEELAQRIDSIKPTEQIEKLRDMLVETIQTRIAELEKISAI
jgi:hypothetical protein